MQSASKSAANMLPSRMEGGGAYEQRCSHPLEGSLIVFDINGLRWNDFLWKKDLIKSCVNTHTPTHTLAQEWNNLIS